jgi:hypothetical protein
MAKPIETTEVEFKPAYDIPKENAVEPVAPTMDASTLIDKYRRLRAKKEEIAEEQKKIMAQYNAGLDYLEGMLLSLMNSMGVDKLSTSTNDEKFGGTVYKTTTTHTSVNSWSSTLDFIKEHEAWELLETRVNKSAVLSILEETGELVPGVTIVQRINVNVRKT